MPEENATGRHQLDEGTPMAAQEEVQDPDVNQAQAQPTAESAASPSSVHHDENFRISRGANAKRQWKRSDKLAAVAIVISVLSGMTSVAATYIAHRAEERVLLLDRNGAAVVAADLGDKLKLLAQAADYSGTFIQAFLDREKQHPQSRDYARWLEFDFLTQGKLPDPKLTMEKLALLSHGSGEVARMSAACASRRDEIEADVESLAAVKPSYWGEEQLGTLRVLPYRFHKLSDLCNQAEKSLATLAPPSNRNEPLRGTVGELMAAQKDEARRKQAGFTAKLEISKKEGEDSQRKSRRPD